MKSLIITMPTEQVKSIHSFLLKVTESLCNRELNSDEQKLFAEAHLHLELLDEYLEKFGV